MNRRVAHLSSNLHGLFATGSIRSRAVLCRRCIHSCKRWGESSVWWVSEEETYSKSNRQKLTLVLAEAELLLPSLPAPVAQRCAVLLKTCATGAGDAVAFFFFFLQEEHYWAALAGLQLLCLLPLAFAVSFGDVPYLPWDV